MAKQYNSTEVRKQLDQKLYEWLSSDLGKAWQATQAWQLRNVLPRLFGTTAIQLGCIGGVDLMESCVVPTRIHYGLQQYDSTNFVRGFPETLPFEEKSIDVALMPHTLDFAEDPHQVLREVQRVLSPEGHAVILGFNPISLWGFWRVLAKRQQRVPWCGQFLSLFRLKDWLRLLDYETSQGAMYFYRPPFKKPGLMERLHFLDKIGDRWWPMAAGGYIIVAQKHVLGMTPLRPAWNNTIKNTDKAANQVATRGAVQRG